MNIRPNNPMQNPRRPLWSTTLLALLLLLVTTSGTAAVRASLDRDVIYTDDIFILTIESDGQLRIPPIEIGGQRTTAITLNVSEAPQLSATETG